MTRFISSALAALAMLGGHAPAAGQQYRALGTWKGGPHDAYLTFRMGTGYTRTTFRLAVQCKTDGQPTAGVLIARLDLPGGQPVDLGPVTQVFDWEFIAPTQHTGQATLGMGQVRVQFDADDARVIAQHAANAVAVTTYATDSHERITWSLNGAAEALAQLTCLK